MNDRRMNMQEATKTGTQSHQLEHVSADSAPQVPPIDTSVLDVQELAKLARIPKATILTLRSRAPEKLPPPFHKHPLLWRRQTVLTWMEREERQEAERIDRLARRRNGR